MPDIEVVVSDVILKGNLSIPSDATALVLFVHGSGSNRFSARNEYVSRIFNRNGLSTLLVDLLTEKEKQEDIVTKMYRFRIDLLTRRLIDITNWMLEYPVTKQFVLGYFSSSTGTAAAMNASTKLNRIRAIVSRGGRSDLAELYAYPGFRTPILFIVGGKDGDVAKMNQETFNKIPKSTPKALSIIPDASHFFDEPGKMDEVAEMATRWFKSYLLGTPQKKFVNKYPKQRKKLPFPFTLTGKLQISLQDRYAAGNILGNMLSRYKSNQDVVVLGIPKGGMVVANAIVQKLSLENFGFIISKRIRNPFNPEHAIGAVTQDGAIYLHDESSAVTEEYLETEVSKQKKDIENQLLDYGSSYDTAFYTNKTVILVDDGCHTGSSVIAASRSLRKYHPFKLILALPVVPKITLPLLKREFDKVDYIHRPRNFKTVEDYYVNFQQVSQSEVAFILRKRMSC
jgi:putative phosphoribosyl transferase